MNKRQVKGKGCAAITIALCAGIALLVELVACVLVSVGVERAVVSEGSMSIIAYILRVFGVVIATILAWGIEPEKKILAAGIAAAVTAVIPVVAAMLFWSIDSAVFGVSVAICALVFFLAVWGMSALGSKGTIHRYKKHYR